MLRLVRGNQKCVVQSFERLVHANQSREPAVCLIYTTGQNQMETALLSYTVQILNNYQVG